MYIVELEKGTWLVKLFGGNGWQPTYVRENATKFATNAEALFAANEFCQKHRHFTVVRA